MKRAFCVTDTHFGARSNSVEWLNSMIDYFYKDFIPKVKDQIQENDCLIHLGDVFDNRQSINLQVLSKVVTLFEDLSKIFPKGIHIIAGNHDIFKKRSTDICSLDCLKNIPDVYVYKEPTMLKSESGKEILLLPWIGDYAEEKRIILRTSPKFVFCHTNITGATFDKYRKVEEGLSTRNLQVKRIFCGHIHWGQQFKNVNLMGTPYQITRADKDNRKGFWLYDFELEIEQFFENTYSPKFQSFVLDDILNLTLSEFKERIKGDIVDLHVNSKYSSINFEKFYSHMNQSCWKFTLLPFDVDSSNTEIVASDLDLRKMMKELAYESVPDDIRNKFIEKFESLLASCE